MGNVRQLGDLFGGREGLHQAIDDLGRYLFDVAQLQLDLVSCEHHA
jgi:hypothetical protein